MLFHRPLLKSEFHSPDCAFVLKRCKVAGQFPQSGKAAKCACSLLALSSITSHAGRTWPKWVGIWCTGIHYEQIDVNCAKALDFCAWRQSEALCGKSIYVTTSKGFREKQCLKLPKLSERLQKILLLPTSFEIEGANGLQVCGLCEALHGSKQLSHISITGSKCIQDMSPPEITETRIF